jgi:hypothetical protein
MLVYAGGKVRDSDDVELADAIIKARQKSPWDVIDLLVKAWARRSPEEVKAVKIDISDRREMLNDKEYGSTMGGNDMERRFTLIFPTTLQSMIRTQYKATDLPFDRKFYQEFSKKYPGFKIAEKT